MVKPLQRPGSPEFEKFRRVLAGEPSEGYVPFFEMIANYFEPLSGLEAPDGLDFSPTSPAFEDSFVYYLRAMARMGYDMGILNLPGFSGFPASHPGGSVQAEDGVIRDLEDFENYPWPSPEEVDLDVLSRTAGRAPDGMGVFTGGPAPFQLMMDQLLGFNHLALMLYDAPDLVRAVADRIGSIMVDVADRVCSLPNIEGFLFSGDMGHKTGTMVDPNALRQFILPWHRRVCETVHRHDKLVVLHSCGNLAAIMDDLVECGYDGKHSYQDAIEPGIYELHRRYGDRMCILGGVDVDFLCRSDEEAIRRRVRQYIDEMGSHGYMLGSGNSIPDYVPIESYRAMLDEGLRYGRP